MNALLIFHCCFPLVGWLIFAVTICSCLSYIFFHECYIIKNNIHVTVRVAERLVALADSARGAPVPPLSRVKRSETNLNVNVQQHVRIGIIIGKCTCE